MKVHAETDYTTLNYSGRSGQAQSPSLLATVLTPPHLASVWSIKVQQGNRSSEWVTPAARGKGTPRADMSRHNVTLTPLLHLFRRKGLFQQQTLTFLDALLVKTAGKLCVSPHWIVEKCNHERALKQSYWFVNPGCNLAAVSNKLWNNIIIFYWVAC